MQLYPQPQLAGWSAVLNEELEHPWREGNARDHPVLDEERGRPFARRDPALDERAARIRYDRNRAQADRGAQLVGRGLFALLARARRGLIRQSGRGIGGSINGPRRLASVAQLVEELAQRGGTVDQIGLENIVRCRLGVLGQRLKESCALREL